MKHYHAYVVDEFDEFGCAAYRRLPVTYSNRKAAWRAAERALDELNDQRPHAPIIWYSDGIITRACERLACSELGGTELSAAHFHIHIPIGGRTDGVLSISWLPSPTAFTNRMAAQAVALREIAAGEYDDFRIEPCRRQDCG